jgi:hypothetical protein
MQALAAIIRTTLSKQPALGNCAAITHGRRIHAALAWLMIAGLRLRNLPLVVSRCESLVRRLNLAMARLFLLFRANWRLRRKGINVNDSFYFFVANR